MSFTLASYNVLATAYLKPEWYPLSPETSLDPVHRIPALVEHLVELRADILCLQEVEDVVYDAIDRRLSRLGFAGNLARKGQGRPDGCAAFFRTRRFEPIGIVRVEYEDRNPEETNSGHVAQILRHDSGFAAEPLPLPAVANDTPLPGAAQPSDHVAVQARFEWRDQEPRVEG